MKKLILALCLLSSPALADSPIEQRFKFVIGNCIGENVQLASQVDELKAKIATLEKQLKESPNAKQVPSASPNNGGGSTQP